MTSLDIKVVQQGLEKLKGLTDDPEAANCSERSIWRWALTSIASGTPDPQGLAEEALKTLDIGFHRWVE